jgi:cytochrome bd-type quinol oxidase subunit 1
MAMNSARRDWKPELNSGYTGRRYYDNSAKTNGWIALMGISFVVGSVMGVVITLGVVG